MKKPFYQRASRKLNKYIENVAWPRASLTCKFLQFNRGHTGKIVTTLNSIRSGGFLFIPDGTHEGIFIAAPAISILSIPSIGLYEGVDE